MTATIAEQCEQDVATAAGQADQGCVGFLALGALSVVVRSARRIVQGGERG
jgi:hypothetical protein